MFAGLEPDQLPSAIEALLFVTDEPVATSVLSGMLECSESETRAACEKLAEQLRESDRGIQLREVAGGWRLFTHPVFHELLENYVLSWDTRKLSQAALEVLAIVAYAQPVTRAAIAEVRGVNSESSISSLLEKGLIREAGTENSPGNPVLLATTNAFLEKFGLKSVEDLPDLESFAPDDDTRSFIASRLSATRSTVLEQAALDFESAGSGDALDDDSLSNEERIQQTMNAMMNNALAQAAGAVEKIDFDDLEFEDPLAPGDDE